MSTELTDLLVVGGPQLNYGRFEVKVRQFPFTFEGINEAYRLLPECNNVVIMPGQDIFATLPVAKDFEWAYENSQLEKCLLELGLVSVQSDAPVPEQISSRLKEIQGTEYSLFTRRTAAAFFAHLCDGMYNIVDSGGDVYMLMPEEYPSWPESDKTFMANAMPGIDIATDSRWSRRVSGEFASMLYGISSGLAFSFGSAYSAEYPEDYFTGNKGELNAPHQILRLLPETTPVLWEAGAVDRENGWRIFVLSWGMGRFIFAPALSWSLILKELGVDGCAGPETSNSACCLTDAVCSDQKLAAPDCDALVKRLPPRKDELDGWNETLGLTGIDGRRGAIRSIGDLAYTLDMLPTKILKSSETVEVYSNNGSITEGEITGDALRKAISRFKANAGVPENLRIFLEEADRTWKSHFRHS